MCTARTPRWGWRGWGTVHFFRVLLRADGVGACQWVGQLAYCTWMCLVWSCLSFLSTRRARTHTHSCVLRLHLSHRRQLCIFLTTITHTHTCRQSKRSHYHPSLHRWLQNQLYYLLAVVTRLDHRTDSDSSGSLTEQIEITWSLFESHVPCCLSEIYCSLAVLRVNFFFFFYINLRATLYQVQCAQTWHTL